MSSIVPTQKGFVRGATINIEEVVKLRAISELDEQEQATVCADAQAIIDALGGRAMIEPEHKNLSEALKAINSILDVADIEHRQLDALERDIVIDAAGSILLLLKTD